MDFSAGQTHVAEDYYKTLGIRRDASPAEVQKAYRDMARKYHPDLNPDDKAAKQKFQQVQTAFDVLSDARKREMYDRYGSAFESVAGGSNPQGPTYSWTGNPGAQGADFDVDLGDLFGQRYGPDAAGGFADIFKQFHRASGSEQRSQPAPARGRDIRCDLTVPFNTAVTGGEAQISVERHGGKRETLTVKIPAGIEDGKKIRLRGQGEKGTRGGQPGDILITLHAGEHKYFERSGKDLVVRVPITLSEAVLGAKVDVPTPKGTITLTVPPHTSSGKKLRVRGHGVATADGKPGDLYAEIHLVLPPSLDADDQELVRRLTEKNSQDPRTELRW